MKRKAILILCFVLICVVLIGCAPSKGEIEPFVGNWDVIQEYQEDRLLSDEPGGFYLTIKNDGTWTLEDSLASGPEEGKLEKYKGQLCLYYDDFRYTLEKDGENLVIHSKNIKEEYPEGKFIFKKVENK